MIRKNHSLALFYGSWVIERRNLMSEVRRDSKGRKLLNGESRRKDGKYEYKYQDALGRRKTVYSWRLTPADRVPAGKRNDISLWEKEKQIQKDLYSNITPDGGDLTVRSWWKSISPRRRVYVTTQSWIRLLWMFVGLTKKNIDFENNRIIVDHQLQRIRNCLCRRNAEKWRKIKENQHL